jgi:hypothetical protein
MLTLLEFGENTGLFDLLLELAERIIKGIVVTYHNSWQ